MTESARHLSRLFTKLIRYGNRVARNSTMKRDGPANTQVESRKSAIWSRNSFGQLVLLRPCSIPSLSRAACPSALRVTCTLGWSCWTGLMEGLTGVREKAAGGREQPLRSTTTQVLRPPNLSYRIRMEGVKLKARGCHPNFQYLCNHKLPVSFSPRAISSLP